jgi:hypothetical protein
MKLLFCQECGDIIAPFGEANRPRWCICKRHAVWWENPQTGVLRVHDARGRDGWPIAARAWVIGMTNLFLGYPESLDADAIQAIIDAHDDYYLFKRQRSVAIRIRPGESGDTRWAKLPEATA